MRVEGPTFKEGDRVFLLYRNFRIKGRPSGKLDYIKTGPYIITKVISPVNYKLKLPKTLEYT